MRRPLLASYLLIIMPLLAGYTFFAAYEIYFHGPFTGIYLTLLLWSMYILCVPAAHGRIVLGAPIKWITGQTFFPEPFFWAIALGLNIVTMTFTSWVYHKTVFTHLLYHILSNPDYWIILLVAALGTWYRFFFGDRNYRAYQKTHTLIRHLFTIIGLFLLFWLTHQEFIIMLNMTVTG